MTGPDGGGQLDSHAQPRLVLAAGASSARRARHFLRAHLDDAGLGDARLRDAAVLVVSELVTNAIRHASGEVVLTLRTHAGQFCLGVHDHSTALPTLVEPYDGGGRGMIVVASIATSWHAVLEPDGKTVWACFTLPQR